MSKQRQILVTVTYNDLGCIIDTKAEPYEEPNLQPTCNQLATDCISRRAAIGSVIAYNLEDEGDMASLVMILQNLPSAQQEIIFCKGCKHRNTDECPMYYEEWIEYDEGDGFVERDFIPQDRTVSDGFCFKGERREDE